MELHDKHVNLQGFQQSHTSKTPTEARNEPTEKFYLPAVTVPQHLSRVEAFIDDLFDFHGVVPIPTSYNR